MRLIDADALKRACSEMVKGSNNSDFIPCPSWNDAMELIDNAPTVTPETSPKVEWICNPTYCYKCNQTNCKADMKENEVWKLGYDSGYEDAENDILADILPIFGLDLSNFKKDDKKEDQPGD